MTCPEPQQHEGGGRNQRSPLPSSSPPRATAGFPRADRGLSPSLIPTDLIPVSQATSPRDEPLRTLHAGRASGSWEGAASPSSHSTSPGGSHCTFATVSGPACCSYLFFFFHFSFPSSFLCRSLPSLPIGWKQHGGEPCKELHTAEQHLLTSHFPSTPAVLGTVFFPPEDMTEGPRHPSAKSRMVHSHWMRDMVWRHVAALAWGGQPWVQGWQLRGCSRSAVGTQG